jgi:hypothetical protein
MQFIKHSFDEIIRQKFTLCFPDLDGNIYFDDGFTADRISTMSIIGRKYYDKFNYIYHPSYYSLYCDDEYTLVAKKNNRILYFDEKIFRHNHPANIGGFIDALLMKTESYSEIDRQNFIKRELNNFQ